MAYLGTDFCHVLFDIHVQVDCGLGIEEKLKNE
jgi:hypothetical protein